VNNKSYYDNCDGGRAGELIGEALNWLEGQGFDFTSLTLIGGNRIMALNVFYAGSPDCGWAKGLWPHKGWYSGFTSGSGITTGDYQITNIGSSLRLGTFCHENGHMIGQWPDLYDYGYESSGAGNYCLMAYGGSSTNPIPPNPYFRDLRGWETIIEISGDQTGTTRNHQANSFTTYRFSHPTNTREFFLIDSRTKNGRNASIPDEGLLIWHIDEDGSNNNEQMTHLLHYRVSVEQADGLFQLENGSGYGGSGDLFHAGYKDIFNDATLPDALWWNEEESGMSVSSISAVSSNMSFFSVDAGTDLGVSPGYTHEFSGIIGGPFNPSAYSYTVYNRSGTSSINWTAVNTQGWLQLSSGGGPLGPGGTAGINISLTAVADTLPIGTYVDTITFTDTTNSEVLEREVRLVVNARQMEGHWKLDETSGATAGDATGHGFDGSLENGLSFSSDSVPGQFSTALDFDGIDDYVEIPPLNLNTNRLTISAWIRMTVDQGAYDGIVFNRTGSAAGLNFRGTGNMLGYHWNDNSSTYHWDSGLIAPKNQWVFVALVVEPTQATIYMHDGTLQSAVNTLTHNAETFGNATAIGRDNSSRVFTGSMDDVRIYNYALDATAIAALVQGGRAENPSPPDEAIEVAASSSLSWLAGVAALEHDVYLGTSYTAVLNAGTGSAEHQIRQSGTSYAPTMSNNTQYYWRIDEVLSGGSIITGEVWSFVTEGGIVIPTLVNHWPLDETTGPTATDVAGGADGTLTNGPVWQGAGGQLGGALAFDGSDDYVDLGAYNTLNGATAFTISGWVNPAQLPFSNHNGIMGIGSSSQRSPWIFGLQNSNNLYVQFETMTGGVADGNLQVGSITQDRWTHIAVSWDGSICSSYIDGVFDNSDDTSGGKLAFSDGANYLGYLDGYGSWDGLLDDIRVYNYTLTEEEIAALYQQGRPSDLDQDGDVDLVDLNLLGEQYLLHNGHIESGGLVVMEAEHFHYNTPGSGPMAGSSWTQMSGSGSVGDGFMQVLPDQGRSINSNLETYSPHLSYQINFSTTGDYYLWVRGMAVDSNADTVHYGAEGAAFSSDYNSALAFPVFAGYSWSSQRGDYTRPVITIDSPGTHSLDFWMREDGAALDRIVLTTDIDYNPNSGGEPSESVYLELTADFNADGVINLADYAAQANVWLDGVE
jgi:M6 family metalloprotease-like protein